MMYFWLVYAMSCIFPWALSIPLNKEGTSSVDPLIKQLLNGQERNTNVIAKLVTDNEMLRDRQLESEKLIQKLWEENQKLQSDISAVYKELSLQANDIAFYVHLSDGDYSATEGSIILYDQVVTNLGNGYNTASGSFTALQHGYYIFTIFFQTNPTLGEATDLAIMVNDNMVCRGDGDPADYNQGVCTAIVQLQVGDVVNVKAVYGDALLNGAKDGQVSGFSGFIYHQL